MTGEVGSLCEAFIVNVTGMRALIGMDGGAMRDQVVLLVKGLVELVAFVRAHFFVYGSNMLVEVALLGKADETQLALEGARRRVFVLEGIEVWVRRVGRLGLVAPYTLRRGLAPLLPKEDFL